MQGQELALSITGCDTQIIRNNKRHWDLETCEVYAGCCEFHPKAPCGIFTGTMPLSLATRDKQGQAAGTCHRYSGYLYT